MATTCYFRFDNDYQHPASSQNQCTQERHNSSTSTNSTAYIATSETIHDPACYVGSGATSHVTSKLDNLSRSYDYKVKGKLCLGDGNTLTISHVDSSFISSN